MASATDGVSEYVAPSHHLRPQFSRVADRLLLERRLDLRPELDRGRADDEPERDGDAAA
jgi:hypothetical protein